MSLYEVFQRDGHLLLNSAGVVDVTGDVEELCTRVSFSAKAHKPGATTTTDRRGH